MATTEEMNRVIAEYDPNIEVIQFEDIFSGEDCGYAYFKDGKPYNNLSYLMWNDLMPVWDKLRDELEKTHKGDAKLHSSLIGAALYQSELERAHRLIYEAITWLNQNK